MSAGLSPRELLTIRTEVQAGSARDLVDKARASIAEPAGPDDWPGRAGSLQYYASALADEVTRMLEREQEWINLSEPEAAQREA